MNKHKSKKRPIHVLMIDDDLQFASSLKNRARRSQVIIEMATNLKDGFDQFIASNKYQAIILDGKAPIHPDQPKGTEAENFVHAAITKIKEIEIKHQRVIPFCVHTAWFVQLEAGLRDRAQVFDKKKTSVDDQQMEQMFKYLHKSVDQIENTKIIAKHETVFDFIDQYLDDEDHALILNLLSQRNMHTREHLLEKLAFIRRIEESVLNVFCKECLGTDPMLMGMGNTSRGKEIIDIIKNKKLAPLHVSFISYVIYTTQSLAVQHKAPTNSEFYNYPITVYTVNTFINGLMDIILWAKESIENKKKY